MVLTVPNYLKRLKGELEDATGAQVTVTQVGPEWIVRLAGPRVRLMARYTGTEHTHPAGAVVWVDGEQHVFKGSSYDFMLLYHYPDVLLSGGLVPVPTAQAPRMPASVQHFAGILRAKMQKHDVVLECGWDGHRWVFGFGEADTGIRIFLTKTGKQKWGISRNRGIQLVVDGQDLSDEVNGQLDQAIKLMNRAAQDPGVAGESGTGESAARAVNSVRERRHSVIRN